MRALVLTLVGMPLVGGLHRLPAQENDIASLVRASQNPISPIINVPLQSNFNFGTGVPGRLRYVLNFQPAVPVALSTDWLLVPRLILPIVHEPMGKDESAVGLGDTELQLLVATAPPVGNDGVSLSLGPAFSFPTASDPVLGHERWALGAAAAIVVMPDPWVAGVLMTQRWPVAGEQDRPAVAPFELQPFINYNFAGGWTIVSAPIITANWMAPDDGWFIPVGGGVSRTMSGVVTPFALSVQGYANVLRPEGAPDWDLRVTMSLLFPRR